MKEYILLLGGRRRLLLESASAACGFAVGEKPIPNCFWYPLLSLLLLMNDDDDDDVDDIGDDVVKAIALGDLPDEILLMVATFLPPRALIDFGSTCKRIWGISEANDELMWKPLCALRFEHWPLYRGEVARFALCPWLFPGSIWKKLYKRTEEHAACKILTKQAINSCAWLFNFTPRAGGRGKETLRKADFSCDGTLNIYPDYRNLRWSFLERDDVAANGGCGAFSCSCSIPCQAMRIENFPLHRIQRIESTRQWLITNEYVTLLSVSKQAADLDSVEYDERGFQTVVSATTSEVIPTGSLQNI